MVRHISIIQQQAFTRDSTKYLLTASKLNCFIVSSIFLFIFVISTFHANTIRMRYNWILFGLSILLSFTCLSPGIAQTPVQITNYNYKNYKGGIQNWGITISPEQILYSSNNNGLNFRK